MIDWWGPLHNSLWVLGLAIVLGALSLASYHADRDGVRLRQKLGEPGFQIPLATGLALCCLGLLFSSRTWWERLLWGVLGVVAVAQLVWIWRGQRARVPVRSSTGHKHKGEAALTAPEADRVPASDWVASAGAPSQAGDVVPDRASGWDVRLPGTRQRKAGGARWLGCVVVAAVLLVLAAWCAITAVQLFGHAGSLQSHLEGLEQLAAGGASELDLGDVAVAGEHLSGMRQDLEAIQSLMGPLLPAGRLLRWVPNHGGDLAAAADLLQVAVGVASAGDRTFRALSPGLDLIASSEGDAGSMLGTGEQLLPVLAASRPELLIAQQELATVEQALARLERSTLSPRVAGLLERLERYLPALQTGVDGALLAPALLGADGPRTYLILAQNNHELRATGGFISGVGELKVDGGRLSSLSFSDSYAVDNFEVPHDITPPDFQHTLFGELWLFRDANWDADFPTSARRALEIYARDRGVQADGAIALDLSALRLLVDAIGPLQVAGIEEPVTGDTVQAVVEAEWSESSGGEGGDWWLHRKDFMGQIAGAAMSRLVMGQDVDLARLALALKRALDEKHVLVYLDDSGAADLLRDRNWDGALPAPSLTSDALLVVDSNVGFNKVDPNVDRSLHYRVDLDAENGPQARLTLTYHNRSSRPVETCIQESRYGDTYADMMDRCYWNYVRVYVPAGSRLLAGPDPSPPPGSLVARNRDAVGQASLEGTLTEAGLTVWTGFFDLAPGEEKTLVFDYQLPRSVLDRGPDGLIRYRLRVQKQPGTGAVPLQVELVLPPDVEVVESVPANLPSLATDLRTDLEFEIAYRERESAP